MESSGTEVIENNYFYDDEGKLVTDSVLRNGQSFTCYRYYYNDDDKLEYFVIIFMDVYTIQKFTYTETDTSRLIIQKNIQYHSLSEIPLLDSITDWSYEKYFHETFDEQGRRTSLMLEQYGSYIEDGKVYKKEFTWTDFDSLLHSSYYNWDESGESGTWREAMRIDNTHDEYGKLLIYKKTFFDARIDSWEIEDQKNYYYSEMPNGIFYKVFQTRELITFPNPTGNEINVILPSSSGSFNYIIYTIYGIALLRGKLENQAIVVSRLKPGIYIIDISNGHTRYSGKFTKY